MCAGVQFTEPPHPPGPERAAFSVDSTISPVRGFLLTAGLAGGPVPQVGCKALVFPKQFKTQQYYDILKQICPELEKAQPGALKCQRWGCPWLGRVPYVASWPPPPLPTPGRRLVSLRPFPRSLTLHPPYPQAPRSDHTHLSGYPSARDTAPGRCGGSRKHRAASGPAPARRAVPVLLRPHQHPVYLSKAEVFMTRAQAGC